MWKRRFDYPILKKLDSFQFEPSRLLADYKQISSKIKFNGLMTQYDGLCKTHDKLPDFFLKKGQTPDETASYSQLALSQWDDNYSLDQRREKSGTLWDKTYPKGNKLADERFYKKPIDEIPPYLSSVLDKFRPYLHRCRFAKLDAKSKISPHIDYDTTYGIRLHIAIKTNEMCTNSGINKNGEIVTNHIPADGSIWFVNQGVKHWAKNAGKTERVHLILSLDTQKYIEHLSYTD